MARLFVAFPLPDHVRAALQPVQEMLDAQGVSVVPPANLHMTVAFLGEREESDIVVAVLGDASRRCAPALVRLGVLGGFPAPDRARVLFAGVDDEGGMLIPVAETLQSALAAPRVGWARPGPFVPHITLGRARRGPSTVVPVSLRPDPVAFTVSSVELCSSTLRGGKAPRYEAIRSFPFA